MKRKLAYLFMVVGVIMIFSAAAILVYNNWENSCAQSESVEVMDSLRTVIKQNKIEESISENDPFDDEMKVVEINGYGYIGYLGIPVLKLDLPVMDQWDYSRLKISPCRYYGSTKTDNLVVAAHNYRSHFGYLGNLQPEDIVIFTDMDAETITYKVTAVELLLPTDVDKVKDCGDDLILYTCTYGGAKRIAVRCNRLKAYN